MFPGVMIVLGLLVLSGAIAYIGDLLGRRFGKKKVSIFGLRPKYTSIIITIISGVMITAVSLAAMLLMSQYVRTALFGLSQLRAERAAARSELVETRRTLDHTLKLNEQGGKDLARLQERFDREQAALKDLQRRLDSEKQQLDALVKDIDGKNAELETVHASLVKVESTLAAADRDVARLTGERRKLEAERAVLVKRKETLEREIMSIATQLSEAQKDILHGEIIYYKHQSLARFFVEPAIAREDMEASIQESLQVLEQTATGNGAVLGPDATMFRGLQIDKVWDAVRDAGVETVVEARSATNVIKGEPFYIELTPHRNKILFPRGEAVARTEVPAGADEEAVRDMLSALLGRVMEEARRRGILPDPKTAMVGTMSVARFQDALAALTNADRTQVVTLFAAQDTRVADKLHVDFRTE